MDWSKIIPIISIIISFSIIIYYIVQSFRATCQDSYEFNDKLNKCVPICKSPFILNSDGTKCICPEGKIEKNGNCIKDCKGDTPFLCGTDSCYSEKTSTCINGKLCSNSLSCGEYCCDTDKNCSNGKLIFKDVDTFILKEKNYDIPISIPKNLRGYTLEQDDLQNFLPIIFKNLLNSGTKNNYKYEIKLKDNKNILILSVSNNDNFQPSLDFSKMNNPEKLGFSKEIFTFNDNLLESKIVEINVCEKRACLDTEIICENNCCPKDNCIKVKDKNVCCNQKDGYTICRSDDGKIINCCNPNLVCCNGKCCAEGEECIGGKCMIKCKYPDKDKKEIYCNPDYEQTGEHCINLDDKKISYCGHKDCVFDSFYYWPPLIDGPGHSSKSKNAINVCVDNTSGNCSFSPSNFNINLLKTDELSNCKYYTTYNDKLKLERTEFSPFLYEPDINKNCTADDCEGRLNEFGVTNVTTDEKNYCFANFDCSTVLEKNGPGCPFGDNHPQCCYLNGNYTGQICKEDQVANYNPESGDCDCIQGWEIFDLPNKRGTNCRIVPSGGTKPDRFSTKKCGVICNPGYYGDNCENIVDVNSFTDSNVLDMLNNLPFVKLNYNGNFESLYNTFPYANYVLVYCLNSNSQYYNFCSNGGRNYYPVNTPIDFFHKSIFGENKGDLIYSPVDVNNVGFWFNTDTCPPVPGSNSRYISVYPNGDVGKESVLGKNVKFFSLEKFRGYPPSYRNLGVLLIGPTS